MIETELKEWGNSTGVILPAEELKKLGLRKGDRVVIEVFVKKRIDGFGLGKGAKPFKEERETHGRFY